MARPTEALPNLPAGAFFGHSYVAGSPQDHVYRLVFASGRFISGSWGNIGNWEIHARNENYRVNRTPEIGSVMLFSSNTVGFVEDIVANSVVVSAVGWGRDAWTVGRRVFTWNNAAGYMYVHPRTAYFETTAMPAAFEPMTRAELALLINQHRLSPRGFIGNQRFAGNETEAMAWANEIGLWNSLPSGPTSWWWGNQERDAHGNWVQIDYSRLTVTMVEYYVILDNYLNWIANSQAPTPGSAPFTIGLAENWATTPLARMAQRGLIARDTVVRAAWSDELPYSHAWQLLTEANNYARRVLWW
ncbi:hypothetical protein FWH13_01595 [Candidatus Saccharibacteria bacterium]|nr:hypothetical protein [Candidatus Saccharibacteria bacterium]